MRILILLISGLVISACSVFPEGDDSHQQQAERENQKISSEYQGVVGVYQGTLKTSEDTLPLKLFMYEELIRDGLDPSGRPISRVVLRSQIKFDGVGEYDDHVFEVDYKPFSGNISLTQTAGTTSEVTCSVGPRDPALAISGSVIGDKLEARMNGNGGLVGRLEMTKFSRESGAPSRDQRGRLLRAYQNIVGTYNGDIEISGRKEEAQIVLNIAEVNTGVGTTCPTLNANFRLRESVGQLDDTLFRVSYRENNGEFYLDNANYDATVRVCSVGPRDTNLRFEGRLKDRKINGEMRGAIGTFGTTDLTWAGPETRAVDDQYQRLVNVYQPLQGTYAGQFKNNAKGKSDNATVGKKNFPFQIVVSMVEESSGGFVTCPVLRGQYIRVDNEFGYGTLSLKIDFYPTAERVVFTSDTPDTGTGIPGARRLSITAALTGNGDMSGDMRWWNEVGRATIDRCRGTSVDSKGRCR